MKRGENTEDRKGSVKKRKPTNGLFKDHQDSLETTLVVGGRDPTGLVGVFQTPGVSSLVTTV